MTNTLLHILFFITGATGLVYQVIWTRMLGHVVGNTTQAIGLVLAAFMAGLALGSFLGGRWADRRSDPLRIYAGLELAVGLCALLVPVSFGLLLNLYAGLHGMFEEQKALIGAARFVVAFLVMIVPTFLMGATLPVLARFAVRERASVGGRTGTLYGANTLGAMIGAGASGFFLMQAFGITGANRIAVAMNLAVAAGALLLHRGAEPVPVTEATPAPAPETGAKTDHSARIYVLLYGLSGLSALALEVLWTKSLAFFLGNTTRAFSTMLSTFLFGISVGAFVMSRRVDGLIHPKRWVGICLIGMGTTGMLTLPLFGTIMNRFGLPTQTEGFLTAALVMLPATLFMGAMLPLTARIYLGHARQVSAQIAGRLGRMYAVNTMGAILGSILAAFVTIPVLGIQGSILVACGAVGAAGCITLVVTRNRERPVPAFAGVAVAAAILVFFVATTKDRFFSVLNYTFRPGFADEVESLYYKETSTGIVELTREDSGYVSYKIDSQNQAKTSPMGMRVHNLISQLGLLLHPHPKDVLMVALGGGTTAGGVVPFDPPYQFNRVDIVEINPAIVEVAKRMGPYNNHIMDFPKLNVVVEDGRNFMVTSRRQYDMIVTGVIHPKFSAGNASIYGREYYQLVKRRVKPDGIVVQWLPINGLRLSEFRDIIATFVDAFPHATLWFAQNYGGFARGNNNLIAIGSQQPLPIDLREVSAKMARPSVQEAMLKYGVTHPLELLDTFITDEKGMRAFSEGAAVIHDDHNLLEYLPQTEEPTTILRALTRYREPVSGHLRGAPPQAVQVLDNLHRISSHLIRADIEADEHRFDDALRRYDNVLANLPDGNPDIEEARKQIAHLAWQRVRDTERDARDNPDSLRHCENLAAALYQFRQWERTIRTYTRCLDLPGVDAVQTHLNIGNAHARNGDWPNARTSWQAALDLAPERVETHFNLGLANRNLNDLEAAQAHLEQAARLAPERLDILINWGQVLALQGRDQYALELAGRILKLEPDNRWARKYLLEHGG